MNEPETQSAVISMRLLCPTEIPETHWVNEPRFAWFRRGWDYAKTQNQAIPALSKCTPGELYHAVSAVMRGAKIQIPDEGHNTDYPTGSDNTLRENHNLQTSPDISRVGI